MTFFIGGNSCGEAVSQNDLDLKLEKIPKKFGQHAGLNRASDVYVRKQLTFQGETKTFYILEGNEPKDFRDKILGKWDWVETDIYSLD